MYDASKILDILVAYLETNYEVLEQDDVESIIPQVQAFASHHFGDEYLTTKYPELIEICEYLTTEYPELVEIIKIIE